MNQDLEYVITLFAFSGGLSILFCLYISIRMQWFIVRRYEVETNLLETIFFKEHANFSKFLPGFFSCAMYASHLLMLLWGWRLYKTKRMYRDIEDPTIVIRNFSKKEIRIVKQFGISSLVVLAHALVLFVFKLVSPKIIS